MKDLVSEYKPSDMLSTKQAANVLGVKPGTLEQWRFYQVSNRPIYRKVGRSVKYRFSDLCKWLEDSAVVHS